MDSVEREAWFERTLQGGYDSDEAWEAVRALHRDASQETFDRAIEWSRHSDPRKRARALDVLCEMHRTVEGSPKTQFVFREEAYARIAELMDTEQDPDVLLSAIYALGHLANEDGVSRILRYRTHSERDYRLAVTCALCSYPNHIDAIPVLLQHCTDSDEEVRAWAVIGLGVLGDADSEEIRAVLLKRLDDESEGVREDAAIGLAKRRDVRLLPKLFMMLDKPDLSPAVGNAAARMLGFQRRVKDWSAADYQTALRRAYPHL